MKKIIMVSVVGVLAFAGYSYRQQTNLTIKEVSEQNQFVFYKGNELYVQALNEESKNLGKNLKIKKNKIISNTNVFYYSSFTKQEFSDLNLSEGYVFFQGIKSPIDGSWIYLERNMSNMDYNLCSFSPSTKIKKVICNQDNNPSKNKFHAFKPIAWSNDKDVIYTEAVEFGSIHEHEGVWEYNIVSEKFKKLNITNTYMSTPILSPNKSYFVYSGTSSNERDQLHGLADRVYLYDIVQNNEKLIDESNGKHITLIGWINNYDKSDVIDINSTEQ